MMMMMMDISRIPKTSIDVVPRKWKKKIRKSWNGTLKEELHNIEMTWNDFGEIAGDQSSCRVLMHIDGLRSEEWLSLYKSHFGLTQLTSVFVPVVFHG